MTTSQYKNIIDKTVKKLSAEENRNSVDVAIKILKNSGISLLDSEPAVIKETLEGGDYLGWTDCPQDEVQETANVGITVIGVSDKRVVVIEPEIDGIEKSDNDNVSIFSDLSPEEKSEMSFYSGGKAATGYPIAVLPDRIAQNSSDPDWNASLWGSHAAEAGSYGCSAACISMALSNLKINKTPADIIRLNGGSFIAQWGNYSVKYSQKETLNELQDCIDAYRNYPNKYAPPIVNVDGASGSHYIVVFELDAYTDIVYAIDPGYYGYDYKLKRIRTNYWRVPKFHKNKDGKYQIIQYYK